RKHGPERDRHLADDVARVALADEPVDPVRHLHRLDATLEEAEERALVALVSDVLARREGDVGSRAGELLAVARLQSGEDPDPEDVVGRHHQLPTLPRSIRPRTSRLLERLR